MPALDDANPFGRSPVSIPMDRNRLSSPKKFVQDEPDLNLDIWLFFNQGVFDTER
jgi:hypothetical protein